MDNKVWLGLAVAWISAGGLVAQAAGLPQVVRQIETEHRERCLASGGREAGSVFSGIEYTADLNGDGLQDYVLHAGKTRCAGVKQPAGNAAQALVVVVGSREGHGRIAYQGEALAAKLDHSSRPPKLSLRLLGPMCSNDLGFYWNHSAPVCWRQLGWRQHRGQFELLSIKREQPRLQRP